MTDEQDYLWERRCRRLYGLLREAGVSDREERLNLFRWVVHDPTISSTNDLNREELQVIIGLLEQWKNRGELIEQARQHSGPLHGRHF